MKRIINMINILLISSILLTGCKGNNETNNSPYKEFITVDVFAGHANYEGIQSGWFGKIVKDKFNMELNIIAPNISGGGDTLFETRFAAGNLGDLIIFNADETSIQDMITADLILDMEPYLKHKQVMRYETSIKEVNKDLTPEGIYILPSLISDNKATVPSETIEPNFGPYIRWDLYRELGYPSMETVEDLLPVLKDMHKLEPFTEHGEKTYGFSFFKDWDNNLMVAAKQPCCMYGYDESGFLLVKADGSQMQSIVEKDSIYIRMLHFLFEANQMGLVDPESTTQNYSTYVKKYADGQIFFSPWPWAAQPEYNTAIHKQQGKGYMLADIGDMKIYSYGRNQTGSIDPVIAIGSGAKDPKRMADFIDWLYSPEGVMCNEAGGLSGAAGPEGLCWKLEDNKPVLTEFGKKALFESNVEVPEEYGGGLWEEGLSEINFKPIDLSGVDDRGIPYEYQLWDSVKERQQNPLDQDWQEVMGAENSMDYLVKHDKILVSPVSSYMLMSETTDQQAIRKQCRKVILEYSWNMVFAEDEQEFDALYQNMIEKLDGLKYQEILLFDMENAKKMINQKLKLAQEHDR